MCGIAGQVRADGSRVEPALVERMCRALEYRGPDSRGTHCENHVGLGIQRLRIIDLDTGDQPIFNEDRSVAVVLNGEIYNYRELRQELQERGHRLATKGDTEVIVHLYEERGPACVGALKGMFAFALWDQNRKRLLLARDRVGKKPLYYSSDSKRLSFASELTAILQDETIARDIDPTALDEYFAYRCVPPPRTAFRNVQALPPAHTLVYESGSITTHRYWRLQFDRETAPDDPGELSSEIRSQFTEAVRRRLISDVPLGAFLSGGIDSAATVAAMAEASSSPVKTFSIGFEGSPDSELPLARVTAERFSTEHHEMVVKPDALEIIPEIVRHYGQPFADNSAVPSFYVARMARQHVTVALNGDGGDESFAGYNHYVGALLQARAARLPRPLRRAISALGRLAPRRPSSSHPFSRARRLSQRVMLDDGPRYADALSVFTYADRDELYTPEFREQIDRSAAPEFIADLWRDASAQDPVNRMMEVDIDGLLPAQLLVKMDIASMASSLEARSPFLDHELMEFAATIPGEEKLDGNEKKVVLRRALRGWIPDQILDGPKRGFAIPTASEWFRTDLRELLRDTVGDGVAASRGYLRPSYVNDLVDLHLSRRADHGPQLWALMMFELWLREFVDRRPTP
jgi:asparagine synthase (glutamine-hydrolysing)